MLKIIFKSESQEFDSDKKEYEKIWQDEGKDIIESFSKITGLDFIHNEINVLIYSGPSLSGKEGTSMKLRANYDFDTKKATLIHELGHKLLVQFRNRPDHIDEHKILFLFLYDVWVDLYGESFAQRAVEVEKKRKGIYDYEKAWDWALGKQQKERLEFFEGIKKLN